jgi:polysaccharide biosynthesis protein PslG
MSSFTRFNTRSYACAAIAAATLALLLAWASPQAASARVPAKFWGVVPQALPSDSHFARIKRGGVDSVRLTVAWSGVEPAKGSYNWSGVDTAVARAARHRLELLPAVWGSPSWVAKDQLSLPVGSAKQRRAWSGFLKTLIRRYGPKGSFWAANPGVPRRPIRTWQIWVEENFFYFTKRPSPTKYAKLVRISHRAIRSADRRARVILGGMFALPAQRPPKAYAARAFLDLMYRRSPGIKRSFDGVALHPYSRSYVYLKATINQVRNVMKRHGDGRTGLWITEVGWGSGHDNGFEKGRKGQARQLKGAFRVFRKYRKPWRLKRVYWFSLDDLAGTCNFCDSSGLFGAGFKPKPAWHAYVRFAGGKAGAGRASSSAGASATPSPSPFAAPGPAPLLNEHPAGWPGR